MSSREVLINMPPQMPTLLYNSSTRVNSVALRSQKLSSETSTLLVHITPVDTYTSG